MKHNVRLKNGREVLSPKPRVVFMQIDDETGEVLQDGRPAPMSVPELYNRSLDRYVSVHDGSDDDDYEMDDSLFEPVLSPSQEGFVEEQGLSEAQARKILLKAGYALTGPNENLPSETESPEVKKSVKKAAPIKQVPSEHETTSGDDAE